MIALPQCNWTHENHCSCAVGQSVRLACERLVVRIQAATDLSRKNRYWQLYCQTLGNWCKCHASLELTIINGCPVHSRCGTLKNPYSSLPMSAEYRWKFAPFYRELWRLHMSEKFSSGTKISKIKKNKTKKRALTHIVS